jgi:hypothetical protein
MAPNTAPFPSLIGCPAQKCGGGLQYGSGAFSQPSLLQEPESPVQHQKFQFTQHLEGAVWPDKHAALRAIDNIALPLLPNAKGPWHLKGNDKKEGKLDLNNTGSKRNSCCRRGGGVSLASILLE